MSRVLTPPSLRTPPPGRERDTSRLRMAILGVVVLSLFATLLARLWYLQVLVAPQYKVEAQDNSVRLVYTEAPRGRILDRNGNVLVDNKIVPTVVADRQIVARHPDVLPRLAAYLHKDVNDMAKRLDDQRYSQYKPVPVADDVPIDQVVYLREHQNDFPGIDVEQLTERTYPYKSLGAHILGYVGEINDTELTSHKSQGYRAGDTIGKSGIELTYEKELRGTPEVEKLQVDSQDHVLRSLGVQPAVPGHDVQLSVDINVQALAEESLYQGLQTAQQAWDPQQLKHYIAPAGAVVVEDPRDGSVLAMASFPTYDPAFFAGGGISTAGFQFLQDPANHYPLNNRAIQGLYAPGSTFKMVTSLAALGTGVIQPGTTIDDEGSYQVGNPPQTFRNAFGTHWGIVNLSRALTVSSDVFFYQLGDKLDTEKKPYPLQEEARSFGLSRPTEVDLPFEADGFVPDPDNKAKRHADNPDAFPYGDWFTGDNVNLAVGQGDLVVTPLQLTNAYATFANGGTIWAPHLGSSVRDVVTNTSKAVEPRSTGKADLSGANRSAVLAGLQRVVSDSDGTASGAFAGFPLDRFPLAGKTGTAEVQGKQETALFVGMGPVDAPRYVVTAVMEESGLGSGAAAPVVRRIFDGLVGNPPKPVARVGDHTD